MRQWIERLNYSKETWKWVNLLSTLIIVIDKQRIQNQFKRMSIDCNESRILIYIETYDLNIYNANIIRMYQLLLSFSISKVVQRLERVNRIEQNQTYFVLLYSLWYVESRNKKQITERVEKVDDETSKENDRDENNAIENDNIIANDNDHEINDK